MKSSTLKTSLLPSSSIPPSNQSSTSTPSSSIPPSPSSSQTPHSHPHTPFLTSNFKRELSVEEIKSPSKFDIPDSLLISILTFSFFKFIKYKRFRIILKGIGTFIALVLYQHAVYDICWFYINDTIYAIYALFLLFGSILLLVLSRSLESLVQYQPENDEQNFTISIINETGYLCGYIDRDLKSCCKVDCTFYIGNYHFYILRFIRYNLNAILITTCWVGSDSSFELLTQRIMNRHDSPRLALDIFLLILSNLLLLYCGQLSGQLGVFGDQHAVESIYDTTGSLILETNSQAENGSASNSPTANGNYNPPLLSPFSTSNPGQKEELSFDERLTERGSSLYERGKMEMSLHFKVTLTLLGLLMYWFCLWDLCWNYPREALIRTVYESRDDDVDSVDSYSRRHISPKVEIYLMLIGILYCIASTIVLILTGGLYSFIHTETDETREVFKFHSILFSSFL